MFLRRRERLASLLSDCVRSVDEALRDAFAVDACPRFFNTDRRLAVLRADCKVKLENLAVEGVSAIATRAVSRQLGLAACYSFMNGRYAERTAARAVGIPETIKILERV